MAHRHPQKRSVARSPRSALSGLHCQRKSTCAIHALVASHLTASSPPYLPLLAPGALPGTGGAKTHGTTMNGTLSCTSRSFIHLAANRSANPAAALNHKSPARSSHKRPPHGVYCLYFDSIRQGWFVRGIYD